MPELDSIQLETGPNPDAAVIWLHGLGADGSDFAGIVPQLQLPSEISIRFIFPHAPIRPITLNQGYQMPGWYDLTSLNLDNEEDQAGIEESSQAIHALCKKAGVSGHRFRAHYTRRFLTGWRYRPALCSQLRHATGRHYGALNLFTTLL